MIQRKEINQQLKFYKWRLFSTFFHRCQNSENSRFGCDSVPVICAYSNKIGICDSEERKILKCNLVVFQWNYNQSVPGRGEEPTNPNFLANRLESWFN